MILRLVFPGKHQAHSALEAQGFTSQSWNDQNEALGTQSNFSQLVDWANKISQANLLRAPPKMPLCSHLLITVTRLPGIGLFFKEAHLTFRWYFLLSKAHSCLLSRLSLPGDERALGPSPTMRSRSILPRLSPLKGQWVPGCTHRINARMAAGGDPMEQRLVTVFHSSMISLFCLWQENSVRVREWRGAAVTYLLVPFHLIISVRTH